MSYQMIERLKFAPVTPTQKLVLLALADCHNIKTDRCNPSNRFLEAVTGLSSRSITASIQSLCNANIVTKTPFVGGKNSYFFTSQTYLNPCTSFRGEGDSGVNVVQGRGEPPAGEGVNVVQDITGIITGNNQNLTGSASSKTRRRKKAGAEKKTDPRFVPFRDSWNQTFEKKLGFKYPFKREDGVQLARFLRHETSMTLDEWNGYLNWIHSAIANKAEFTPGIIKHAAGSLATACSRFSQLLIHSQS